MALTYYQINDIINATLVQNVKKKVSNIDPTLLRGYVAARRLMKKNMVTEQGGRDITWDVNVSGSSSAAAFGPYATKQRTVGDHLKQASMQMRNFWTDFSFDILEEVFNQGEHSIVNHVKNREMQADIDAMAYLESHFWSFADTVNDADDEEHQGILYYLPYCTETTMDFNGTVSGSHTTVAGLSPTTYTGWKSLGAAYSAVTKADLIYKMRKGFDLGAFEPPLDSMPISDHNTGNQYGLYCNLDTRLEFEDRAEDQNDNLGTDLDSMNGRARFRMLPFQEVPHLEDNTRDPIIGINWGVLKNYVKKGWFGKVKQAPQNSDQPLAISYDKIWICQLVCFNRRLAGFNIAKAA